MVLYKYIQPCEMFIAKWNIILFVKRACNMHTNAYHCDAIRRDDVPNFIESRLNPKPHFIKFNMLNLLRLHCDI